MARPKARENDSTQWAPLWADAEASAARVRDAGVRMNLPFIAAHHDLGDPDPMRDQRGVPYAETTFRWIDPEYRYWEDRRLALHSPFLKAARLLSEPFFYANGALATWRPTQLFADIGLAAVRDAKAEYVAIVCPAHLPRGVIGAIVWAGRPERAVAEIFAEEAVGLHALAMRFISAHVEASAGRKAAADLSLTRREAQCLKWAAAGKTDSEIATIMALSVSTVRFHMRNAAEKLGAVGRAQAIQYAASLGFIGAR